MVQSFSPEGRKAALTQPFTNESRSQLCFLCLIVDLLRVSVLSAQTEAALNTCDPAELWGWTITEGGHIHRK